MKVGFFLALHAANQYLILGIPYSPLSPAWSDPGVQNQELALSTIGCDPPNRNKHTRKIDPGARVIVQQVFTLQAANSGLITCIPCPLSSSCGCKRQEKEKKMSS